MENAWKLSLCSISEGYTRSDVLLVLGDVAVHCQGQSLSLRSAVLRNTLADLPASQLNARFRIPLADFSEAQYSALLGHLHSNGMHSTGAAFAKLLNAAVDKARFARTYDVPHALRQLQAYLRACIDERIKSKCCGEATGKPVYGDVSEENLLEWALMADEVDTHELRGPCKQAMTMY